MAKVSLQNILAVYSGLRTAAVRVRTDAYDLDEHAVNQARIAVSKNTEAYDLDAHVVNEAKIAASKNRDGDTYDLTTFIGPFDSAGLAHCCCDSAGFFEFFGAQDRTDECHVFFGQGCGSLTQESLKEALGRGQGGEKALRRYTGSPSGKCRVDAKQVDELAQLVLQTTSQSEDPAAPGKAYCASQMEDGYEIPASGLGGSVSVRCGTGHEASRDTSTCVYVSPEGGALNPAAHCHRINDYCRSVHAHSSEGLRAVNAAPYGFQRAVSCDFAYVPTEHRARCAENRTFVPTPTCVRDPNFCSAFESDGASAPPAAWGEVSSVSCAVGKTPDVAQVECQRGRTFSPTPTCTSIPDFCKAVPANADGLSISEAALGEEGVVSCAPGSRVERPGGVICGEDGNFSFTRAPVCSKVSDWCAEVSDYSQHVREVASAALGYRRNVVCTTGTQAEVGQVECGEDGQFHPTPKCS